MQSDMPVVNNTQHRPKEHGKPKGFTNSGNEWEQAELFLFIKKKLPVSYRSFYVQITVGGVVVRQIMFT